MLKVVLCFVVYGAVILLNQSSLIVVPLCTTRYFIIVAQHTAGICATNSARYGRYSGHRHGWVREYYRYAYKVSVLPRDSLLSYREVALMMRQHCEPLTVRWNGDTVLCPVTTALAATAPQQALYGLDTWISRRIYFNSVWSNCAALFSVSCDCPRQFPTDTMLKGSTTATNFDDCFRIRCRGECSTKRMKSSYGGARVQTH